MKEIRIGTRGSRLALWQAKMVQSQLTEQGQPSTLVIIKTKGDRIQHLGFDKLEGKGFFTKEIEEALLQGTVDLAVHSLKDLPTEQPEGLALAGLSYREDPADLLLIHPRAFVKGADLSLMAAPVVGTSSVRRKAQMRHLLPDCEVKDLRGNVPTRVSRLAEGDYDAIILAAAGVRRLDLDLGDLKALRLHPKEFVPAPGQGVIAYQVRADDKATRTAVLKLHNADSAAITNVERRVLQLMEGGCQTPLGVHGEKDQAGNYHFWAAWAPDLDKALIQVRVSQNTHFGIAEAIVSKLKNHIVPS